MIAYAATLVALAVVLWPAARPVGAARDRGAGRPLPRALRAAREDGSLGPAHAVGAMDPVGSTHGAAATRRSDSGAASRRRAPAGPRVRPDEVAVVMDLIAVCCRSGGALVDALSAVGTVSEARVRRDLSCVVAALAWGVDADQAWALVGSAWRPVARALTLATRAGVPPADALGRGARDLRAEHARALDVAAARLGVTIVLPLGLAFLPAFVLLTVVPVVVALTRQLIG